MIEYLSPREYDEVVRAEGDGRGWARVVRCFLDGPRMRLGWDQARSTDEIARLARRDAAAAREAIDDAVRWAARHRLHLLGWHDDLDDTWRYFMAVG